MSVPTVSTVAVTNGLVTGRIISDGGSNVFQIGICWSENSQTPDIFSAVCSSDTIAGDFTGDFTKLMTNLTPGATYYVRAYAENAAGTSYGDTLLYYNPDKPTVITGTVAGITNTGTTVSGNITSNGGTYIIERGICWSKTVNPSMINGFCKTSVDTETGTFSFDITGLVSGTQYYVRAYAKNSAGTAYGNEVSFKTLSLYRLTKTASPASGGTVSASPDKTSYTEGDSVTLSATPNVCYEFTGWSGACSGTACTLTMDSDKSVTANFKLKTYSLNINANNGTVTKNPNKTSYGCGEKVTLTAVPNSCYEFTGFSGACSGTACTLTMDSDKTVSANFRLKTFSLNITATNGTVTKNPNKTSYDCGEKVTLTATPNTGYKFDHWEGDLTGNQSSVNVTMNWNMTVKAVFAPVGITYNISGYIRDSSNNIGISNVTLINNNGDSATTNNSGYYTLIVSNGWSGTITPSKQGYTFSPSNRSYADVTSSQFSQDYTGNLITFTISGYVRDSANNSISGIKLNFSNYGGSVTTESSGFYSHQVYYGWSGTVTPEKSGYTFTPSSQLYTNVTFNKSAQNYTGNPTAKPDIDVSPESLIFTKNKTREQRSKVTSEEQPATPDNISLVTGQYSTGLIVPEHVKEYWKINTPSQKYRMRKNLPSSKDWSVYDSPVRNQGRCGSCWAFATVAMMENLANQANFSVEDDFAEQALVSCMYQDRTEGRGCEGGWYWDAFNYIQKDGIPNETCYSYNEWDKNCGDKCSVPDFLVKITQFTPSSGLWGSTQTVDDLKGALQDGPLCVAMYVPDDFFSYSGGIYDYKSGNMSWGHAVFLVGYDDSKQCFKVKNSWGTYWGEGGYFRIAYDDVYDIEFGSYAAAASGIFLEQQGSITQEITVKNTGTADLVIKSISADRTWLNISPETLPAISPGQQQIITVSVSDWNSVNPPEDTGKITISSNDADEPSAIVEIKAIIPPQISRPLLMVSPPFREGISVTENKIIIDVSGSDGTVELDVSNGDAGTMTWTAISYTPWLDIIKGGSGIDQGTITVSYEANTGNETRTGAITIDAPGAVNSPQIVEIRQSAALDGDTDGDETVDLNDAILALKVIAGMDIPEINLGSDIKGDGKIGLDEAVYVLQVISGLRD